MADYTAIIKISVGITAKNQEQAEERAQELADSYESKLKAKWVGDAEMDTEVEEA